MSAEQDIERWFTYHPPKNDEPKRYEVIRAKARELAEVITTLVPVNDDRAAALRALRESVMWANAAIAARPDFVPLNPIAWDEVE